LGPGDGGTPDLIDLTSQPVIAPQVSRPFSISLSGGGVISGVVTDRVVLTTDGRYAFEGKVILDPSTTTSTAGINQVIRSNFSAFPLVEAAREDLDVINRFFPTNAARNAAPGATVGFTFDTPINVRDANTDWLPFVVVTAPGERQLFRCHPGLVAGAGTANVGGTARRSRFVGRVASRISPVSCLIGA
jgi:hypothetical protein